jgi:hypothetical protein
MIVTESGSTCVDNRATRTRRMTLFSASYLEARDRFKDAAARAGACSAR